MADGRNPSDHLGDYELLELLSEGTITRSWRARQLSVEREVILEIVKKSATEDEEIIAGFLADVRIKARLQHPAIGHVYEAHNQGRDCYYAREALSGKTIEAWIEEGKKLTPLQVALILESIADSQIHCETRQFATVPWQIHHIHLSSKLEPKLVNLAVDGALSEEIANHNKQLLGEIMHELLDTSSGHPGTTRTLSLLDYMSNEHVEQAMSWEQVREYAQTIQQQLTSARTTNVPPQSQKNKKPIPPWVWALVFGLATLTITALAFRKSAEKEIPTPIVVAPETHLFIDENETVALAISEVSIAEYAEFLKHLDQLPEEEKNRYDHPEQTPEKTDHLPDDWPVLLDAAKNQTHWRELRVTLDCPIVGVDWWDATAYATWKNERLPSESEWDLACRHSAPPISDWGPVRVSKEDRTANGLIGMAGNVAEWVADQSVNPANPLDPKKPVARGGSYLNPGKGPHTRQWLESRDVRQPDLGFRTVKDRSTQ